MSTVLVEVADRIGTVTLNRPEARNAISLELMTSLRETLAKLDTDESVDVVILTGADPAFCAGLDLKELGSSGDNLGIGTPEGNGGSPYPWEPLTKPVIGAVNGPAVTGGFEFALNCDLLIASDRARFADTHARVGVLPGWGLSVLLPQVVGRALARWLSLTGDYLGAEQALAAGLVSEVVPHADLLPAARRIAGSILSNNQDAVRALLASYRGIEAEAIGAGYAVEAATGAAWLARGFAPADVEARRLAVLERGRSQNR